MTLRLALGTLVLGFVIGLPIALLRVYGSISINRLLLAYINFFRGTPLLVQLFLVILLLAGHWNYFFKNYCCLHR